MFFLIAAILPFLMVPSFADAAEEAKSPSLKVAVVELQILLTQSEASKKIGSQLEAHRSDVMKELSSSEAKLVETNKALVELSKTEVSKEDFTKQAQSFEEEKLALQKLSVKRRNALTEASVKAERALMDEIVKVLESMAKENSYDLILTKQNVIVGTQSLDITDEALVRLNKAVSTIKVEYKN